MTLIIGIKCSDGIVVGADSAATFGDVAQGNTITQPVSKIDVIKNEVIMATSGHVGLAQLHIDSISRAWTPSGGGGRNAVSLSRSPSDIRRRLHEEINKDSARVAQGFETLSRVIGPNLLMQHLAGSLVAFPTGGANGTLELVEFGMTGTNEAATSDLPFVAIGSGKPTADPFLAHLRRIFWPNSVPTLTDGIFALVWALDHSIEVSPGGLSQPIEIVVMRQGDRNIPVIETLPPEELGEHRQHVIEIEDRMREFREDADGSIDEPPQVPSQSRTP